MGVASSSVEGGGCEGEEASCSLSLLSICTSNTLLVWLLVLLMLCTAAVDGGGDVLKFRTR